MLVRATRRRPLRSNSPLLSSARSRRTGTDDRLPSCPDDHQVRRRRQREAEIGGPAAPHNSIDNSVIDINDDSTTDGDGDVFRILNDNIANMSDNFRSMTLSLDREGTEEITREPETISETIVIEDDDEDPGNDDDNVNVTTYSETMDVNITRYSEYTLNASSSSDESTPGNLGETIYLTDSPVSPVLARAAGARVTPVHAPAAVARVTPDAPTKARATTNGDNSAGASNDLDTTMDCDQATLMSVYSALRCPICFDSYQMIQRKGI